MARVIMDVKVAQELLPIEYPLHDQYASAERARVNKFTATSLLSRAYLYLEQWDDVIEQSTRIIDYSNLYNLEEIQNVFLKDSKEAIWHLAPNPGAMRTYEAEVYIITGLEHQYYAMNDEYANNGFEEGDARKDRWISSYEEPTIELFFPYKYQSTGSTPSAEYSIVMRLSEQYLIRAEAYLKKGIKDLAIADINQVRQKRRITPSVDIPNPLPDIQSSISDSDVLSALMNERRNELFCEWGHRWLDLKRWKISLDVLGGIKPGFTVGDTLYPIPLQQMQRNPNTGNQNPEY